MDWQMVNYFQLEQLTELIHQGLSPLQHKIVVTLYTTDVHNRDIIDRVIEHGVKSVFDFQWVQQLRYYWDDQIENILVKQVLTPITIYYSDKSYKYGRI